MLIARMLRDKGVVEFVKAAQLVRQKYANSEFCLIGPAGAENRSAIDGATIRRWVAEEWSNISEQ